MYPSLNEWMDCPTFWYQCMYRYIKNVLKSVSTFNYRFGISSTLSIAIVMLVNVVRMINVI